MEAAPLLLARPQRAHIGCPGEEEAPHNHDQHHEHDHNDDSYNDDHFDDHDRHDDHPVERRRNL
jgi:hypothetical protein